MAKYSYKWDDRRKGKQHLALNGMSLCKAENSEHVDLNVVAFHKSKERDICKNCLVRAGEIPQPKEKRFEGFADGRVVCLINCECGITKTLGKRAIAQQIVEEDQRPDSFLVFCDCGKTYELEMIMRLKIAE